MTFATQRSLVPSLGALQAFEAAARLGSFTRAAEELNLTQGAISRQVAALEESLGVTLFERVRQRVTLTPTGQAYAAEIREALSRIASATLSAMAFRGAGGTLALAILPTFGTRWLIPRLPDFFQKHPEVTINFATRIRPFDFREEQLDAAIHFGDPAWPGAVTHRLMGEVIVPVASPGLIASAPIRAPADVLRVPLLQQSTRPRAWANWLELQGLPPGRALMGPSFEQFAMVAQAAVAGLGMAIVPRMLVEEELRTGQLVVPFDRPLDSRQGYWLVYPEEKRERHAVVAFRDWLLAQCGRERDETGPAMG
ncbi:LysR family transcriptional regulator [Alsobacter soli]|uniref:LysR family transcriptional regulator n=1 Tax=Alsobacter soli TaxID=2109933 RepID=A0A2T1HNV7_9HYPH|nr:transcriptional regulator GcvA [Alsobacter soli]PSC03330.1 LysR family transcriptional regulator [Alsobacter soli]